MLEPHLWGGPFQLAPCCVLPPPSPPQGLSYSGSDVSTQVSG